MKNDIRAQLEREAEELVKQYGPKAGALGSKQFQLDVVPTGSLALDYALGTGGWPLGHPIHLWGEPDIGKSSTLGLAAIRGAQQKGLVPGLLACEPGFDPEWAAKNGVDPELMVVARPNDGEQAFNILQKWVFEDRVDFILFDSIGAVVDPDEVKEEGKVQVGGASKLITFGIRRVIMQTWKANKGLIFLNHVRDDLKSRYQNVKPPGGWLVEHACDIWVQLRQSAGSESWRKIKDGKDYIDVGRNLTAVITRNKLCEGTGKRAKFWYNMMSTEEHGPVGIDTAADIIATGIRTGIIHKSGNWYSHESFPGDKHHLQGEQAVGEFLLARPEVVETIRENVMKVMMTQVKAKKYKRPDLHVAEEVA